MERLTLAGLERRADELDRAALGAAEIDRFCSSSAWILPAAEALMPRGASWVHAGADGFFTAMRRRHGARRVIEPLEASWGLASALVAPRPEPLVSEVAAVLRAREAEWDLLVLAGMPVDSALLAATARRLGGHYRLGLGPQTRRHVASLEGGLDGFLSRRARRVRKTVRQAERRAADLGIRFEEERATSAAEADRLFDRALAVERRSWKGQGGIGLDTDGFREFYRLMARRLAGAGRLRCMMARQDEEDVAYVLGAVFGDTYRGLQFSFDDRLRAVGLGNLAQVRQVAALEAEPAVTRYDLGTGGDYKADWAEQVEDSVVLVAGR